MLVAIITIVKENQTVFNFNLKGFYWLGNS